MPKIKTATKSRQRMWVMGTVLPLLAGLMGLAAMPARSQTGKPDAAEAAAAMQRAERIASNPMRLILQAGKINRKSAADEPALAVTTRAPTPLLMASAASLPNAARSVPEPIAEPAPAPVVVESVYKADARMKAAAPEAFAPLSSGVATGPLDANTVSAAAPALVALVDQTAPKLKRMVEVDMPSNVQDQLRRGQEVLVKFMVAADGSVSDVSLPAPAPRQLARLIQAAVSQWQFEPMAAARAHAVNLVFNAQ
jgi:hypothetical protein